MKSLQAKEYETHCGSIRYWTNTVSDSPCTLVFLPGLTADHRLFEKQIEFFGEKCHVLVWDAPAHNASRPFELRFSLMDKAMWLHEILAQENITRPVLIGQSMGGYVAQCYMQQFPNDISAFISIDSAPLKRKYSTAMEIFLLRHCEWMYRIFPWKLLVLSGAKGCSTTAYGQNLMREMMSTYSKNDYCALAGHGYRMLAEAMAADLEYNVSCPTLLICGEKDQAGSAKRYNRAWAKGENLPIRWIVDAGHNSNTDCPDEINRIIDDFVINCKSEK